MPLEAQRVTADPRIEATRGKVALRYGPMIYNVELADQANIGQQIANAPLVADWRPDLLGGVVAIKGQWRDGTVLTAIPNFARLNREAPSPEFPRRDHHDVRSLVWMAADS